MDIRKVRRFLDIRQSDLSAATGIPVQTISIAERGGQICEHFRLVLERFLSTRLQSQYEHVSDASRLSSRELPTLVRECASSKARQRRGQHCKKTSPQDPCRATPRDDSGRLGRATRARILDGPSPEPQDACDCQTNPTRYLLWRSVS
jgi:hypothetical protein